MGKHWTNISLCIWEKTFHYIFWTIYLLLGPHIFIQFMFAISEIVCYSNSFSIVMKSTHQDETISIPMNALIQFYHNNMQRQKQNPNVHWSPTDGWSINRGGLNAIHYDWYDAHSGLVHECQENNNVRIPPPQESTGRDVLGLTGKHFRKNPCVRSGEELIFADPFSPSSLWYPICFSRKVKVII